MALSDASHRIIADLLKSRTGQELTESRLWRVPSALSAIFRERGISNVDQLVCLLANPGEHRLAAKVVEALLKHGADPNVRGRDGKTALSFAIGRDYHEIVRLLKDAGAVE